MSDSQMNYQEPLQKGHFVTTMNVGHVGKFEKKKSVMRINYCAL